MINLLNIESRELSSLVSSGKLKIAIYGLGYVGLSIAAVWLRAGAQVIGVDINSEKVRRLNYGDVGSVEEVVETAIKKGLREGRFRATLDGVEASRDSHVKLVTVPVGMNEDKEPVLEALKSALKTIGSGLKKGDLVVVESSVPVGTTRNIAKPLLEEASGLKAEDDFGLAYSPERIYIGRAVKDIEENYPKIVAGIGEKSLEAAVKLYSIVARRGVIPLPSPEYAELEKLFEGVYRDVNIALANQLALLCRALGLDYDKVRAAANSQPYCHLHKPGAGVGGACIPVYSYFVQHAAKLSGIELSLVVEGRKVNEMMPFLVAKLIDEAIKQANLTMPNIVVLGLAFRGGVDDTRYSPAYEVIGKLLEMGYKVSIVHDPYVKKDYRLEKLGIQLIDDLEKALKKADVVVIVTDHPEYKKLSASELKRLSGKGKLVIVDSRHSIKNLDNIPQGVFYTGVGKPSIIKL